MYPFSTAYSVAPIWPTDSGRYCFCFISSVTRWPRSSCARVAASRSEANCANAASSRYWASARRTPPPSFLTSLVRSEEHTSELQSLMRISYAVFCLKKKKQQNTTHKQQHHKYTH